MEEFRSVNSFKKRYYPKSYQKEIEALEDPHDTGDRLAKNAFERVKTQLKL